jgi:hypothetical protein
LIGHTLGELLAIVFYYIFESQVKHLKYQGYAYEPINGEIRYAF